MPLLNLKEEVDVVYYYSFYLGIIFSILGFIIGDFLFPVSNHRIKDWMKRSFLIEHGFVYDFGFKFLAVFSAVVCIAYFVAVGYNVFLLGFANAFLGGGDPSLDVSGMRLKSYNSQITGEYYYPGFVNQFKDTLLPLTMFYLWAKYIISPARKSSIPFLVVFTIIAIVSILGTGQRGAFALAMMMGGCFMLTVLPSQKRNYFLIFSGVPALLLFMVSTFINGRTKSDKFEVGATFEAMWERIASDNQWGAYIGFRDVMYPRGIQWGYEWWEGLLGLTPWHSGSILANEIAISMWGGFGNAPPSSWGSIYYNFGFLGIMLYPLVTCVIIKYFYQRFYLGPKRLFRTLVYVYACLIYGTWIAGSPIEYYANVGIVTIALLKVLFNLASKMFGQKLKRVYQPSH
jgi:hypothetical protein